MKEQDSLRRFLFEELGVRGEWVSLHDSWKQTTQHQKITEVVQVQLGQALTAAVLLSATIKFEGSLILQAQGEGALKTLVAQSTHDRKIRGLARSDHDNCVGKLSEMMGAGRLVVTIEPKKGEPYQGVVALTGHYLADSICNYFMQSEQLETRVWLFANNANAVGLLIQELPGQKNCKADWERICALANTVTKHEMLTLNCEEVLYRLFNEEKVRLFEAESVTFECSCSRQKIEETLLTLGVKELTSILLEKHIIDVDCEFCGIQYCFDKIDVEKLCSMREEIKE